MKFSKETATALVEVAHYLDGKPTKVRVSSVPVDPVDVRVIRERLNLTQQEFAAKYGFPVATVRNWEQGRRYPEGAARILLTVINTRPEIVEDCSSALRLVESKPSPKKRIFGKRPAHA